ncbi:DUF6491 family protein [Simiduia agarivorans]|uniref:Uncharacterized protein n=1 Tax=Simiduia agarivorans (strain DSM 21679 / JCM 13881 / BCRC 17597 / SA1) TaxID=1117647 RepID=K4KKE0_SIMAS|nr:DUF6491 family protein [Simiduia agarivorans]AFU98508.1 hypothetical protein M5M_06565 [Simiduia agarivorans SA1 = DSM 21679]
MKQLTLGIIALLASMMVMANNGRPDYQFDEFKSIDSFRSSDIKGWGRINDQVLTVSAGANKRYLLVLTRPDRDIAFSHAIGVTSNAGRVMARFDGVYAGNANIRVKIPIKYIYEIKGKDQFEQARALVEERALAAKSAGE